MTTIEALETARTVILLGDRVQWMKWRLDRCQSSAMGIEKLHDDLVNDGRGFAPPMTKAEFSTLIADSVRAGIQADIDRCEAEIRKLMHPDDSPGDGDAIQMPTIEEWTAIVERAGKILGSEYRNPGVVVVALDCLDEYRYGEAEAEKPTEDEPAATNAVDDSGVTPGRYQHFSGSFYDVIGVAADSTNCAGHEAMVVYRSLEGQLWVRRLVEFTERMENGEPRFRRVETAIRADDLEPPVVGGVPAPAALVWIEHKTCDGGRTWSAANTAGIMVPGDGDDDGQGDNIAPERWLIEEMASRAGGPARSYQVDGCAEMLPADRKFPAFPSLEAAKSWCEARDAELKGS